jgi:hypothetical protein
MPPETRQPFAAPVYRPAGAHRCHITLIFPSQFGGNVLWHIEVIDRAFIHIVDALLFNLLEKRGATKHFATLATFATVRLRHCILYRLVHRALTPSTVLIGMHIHPSQDVCQYTPGSELT